MILLGCHLPAEVHQFAPIFSFFLDSILKSRDITLPTKVRIVKDMVFPVVVYGYEHWTIKKAESENCSVMSNSLQPHTLYSPWNSPGQNTGVSSSSLLQGIFPPRDWTQASCTAGRFFTSWATREAKKAERQRIDVFELQCWRRLWESLDCKEIKPVNPKGNQPWIFIGRTDADAETPILWPPNVKSWLIRKDLDAGKDWRQEEKGTTEDEMVGWHHCLDGWEFEQAQRVSDGQGSLVCYTPWSRKELYTTEQLNWT